VRAIWTRGWSVGGKRGAKRGGDRIAPRPAAQKPLPPFLSHSAQYCRAYRFSTTLPTLGPCDITFTCVAGHMTELDFPPTHKGWRSVDPASLYDAPVAKRVPPDKAPIERNLRECARVADVLILWLDCDREGENIAFEVIDACRASNPRLRILRARFSAVSGPEVARAVASLGPPNRADARAVDARQEIDLRVGASFTRLQTLLLQEKFEWGGDENGGGPDEGNARPAGRLISYGPCQFPTLGLIVLRAWEIRAHQPEPFWSIEAALTAPTGGGGGGGGGGGASPTSRIPLAWARGRLFDRAIATALHADMASASHATITAVHGVPRTREPPAPLSTLELQKAATRRNVVGLSGDRVMKLAEELYQAGYISYPRTETDGFNSDTDVVALVQAHADHPAWGPYARRLLSGELYRFPRAGGHNDRAHPPIHPTRCPPGAGDPTWCEAKRRLYDFIARSFLAACSRPAQGQETRVEAGVGPERFGASGLMVIDRAWLDVYPYTTWGGGGMAGVPPLPPLAVGQRVPLAAPPSLRAGETAPPPRLAEGDLLAAMDRFGIGTDATMVDHIKTLLARGYAAKDEGGCFGPRPLGEALVSAYRRLGLGGLWEPALRGQIESSIRAVASGHKTKEAATAEAVGAFRAYFEAARRGAGLLEEEVGKWFARRGGGGGGGGGGPAAADPATSLGPCPAACGAVLVLRAVPGEGSLYAACSSAPLCRAEVALPTGTSGGVLPPGVPPCARCGSRRASLRFRRSAIPVGFDPAMEACLVPGCDRALGSLLAACGPLRVPRVGGGGGPPGPPPPPPPARRATSRAPAGAGAPPAPTPPPPRARDRAGAAATAAPARARGRGGAASLPLCPKHNLPVLSLTSRKPISSGRVFYKCSVDGDQQNCLEFAWADEHDGGGGGGGRAGGSGSAAVSPPRSRTTSRAPARAGRGQTTSRGASAGGGSGGRGGGRGRSAEPSTRFAPAAGGGGNACFKCGQPGHWSNSCPNG